MSLSMKSSPRFRSSASSLSLIGYLGPVAHDDGLFDTDFDAKR